MIYIINPITLLLVYILYTITPAKSYTYKPIMYLGAILDFTVNVTWFTLIFLDLPRELLLTKRIERLKQKDGYRGNLARLLCKLLNYFQDNHCQ